MSTFHQGLQHFQTMVGACLINYNWSTRPPTVPVCQMSRLYRWNKFYSVWKKSTKVTILFIQQMKKSESGQYLIRFSTLKWLKRKRIWLKMVSVATGTPWVPSKNYWVAIKLLSSCYRSKTKPNGNRTLNFGAGNGNWWRPCLYFSMATQTYFP